jgi:cobalt-zinc-cadmium efflux system membrane fusion protein
MQTQGLLGLGVGVPIVVTAIFFSLDRPRPAEGESAASAPQEGAAAQQVAPTCVAWRTQRPVSASAYSPEQTPPDDAATAPNLEPPIGSAHSLRRTGRLALDPNRLARVHARFGGQVVAIGDFVAPGGSLPEVNGPTAESSRETVDSALTSGATLPATPAPRTLRFGDPVRRGQLLAIVWSKEFGEKKSDLVNALSKMYLDREQFQRLRDLEKGIVAERQVIGAQQQFEADEIEVERIERTLRSWRVDEAEIVEIRNEADRIHRGEKLDDRRIAQTWAEVDVRAPFDGVLLEKNVTAGDMVDTTLDLFKVGDLSSLLVMIDLFEEDVPLVAAVEPRLRRWTIRLKGTADDEGVSGAYEVIGDMVDPQQHTVALMGWLGNPSGKLRAGQFVTADIPLR